MGLAWLFFAKIFTNLWVYGTGFGPVALDGLAQLFLRPYREWAGKHGTGRRWFITIVALAGFVWASFSAFQEQYQAAQNANAATATEEAHRAWWAGIAEDRRQQLEGKDGRGGLQKQLADATAQIIILRSQKPGASLPPIIVRPPAVNVEVGPPQIQDRHLSDYEKKRLKEAFEPIAKLIMPALNVYAEPTGESFRYALEFVQVLKGAGVNAWGPSDAHAASKDDRGIMVGMMDPDKPSPMATKFIAALTQAGFKPHVTPMINAPVTVPDFDLFIAPP